MGRWSGGESLRRPLAKRSPSLGTRQSIQKYKHFQIKRKMPEIKPRLLTRMRPPPASWPHAASPSRPARLSCALFQGGHHGGPAGNGPTEGFGLHGAEIGLPGEAGGFRAGACVSGAQVRRAWLVPLWCPAGLRMSTLGMTKRRWGTWGTRSSCEEAPSFPLENSAESPGRAPAHCPVSTTEGPVRGVNPRPLLGLLRPVPRPGGCGHRPSPGCLSPPGRALLASAAAWGTRPQG